MRIADQRRSLLRTAAVSAVVVAVQLWWSWQHLHRQITTDESFTYFAANGGLSDLVGACRADPAMSAYYVLAFVVAHLSSGSIFTLRVLTFVCYVAIVVLVCALAQRRGRWWAGPLALAVVGATPIVREAVVDARAAVLAALVAVVLVLALGRLLATRSDGGSGPAVVVERWVALVACLIAVLVFVHPSGLGPAGVAWLVLLWSAHERGGRVRWWLAGASVAVLLALAANVLQADSADGLVEPGLAGVHRTLGLMWGGNSLLAVATIVAVAVVVALDGRHNTVTAAAAGGSVAWTVLLLVAVPAVTLFVARYLVVACVLLAVAAVGVAARHWRGWLLLGVAVVCLVGSFLARDRWPGAETRWCTVADIVEQDAVAGDVVVFPYGSSVTPVMACLGEGRTAALFAGLRTLPSLEGVDRSNPRAVWRLELDGEALLALADSAEAQRVLLVRSGENEASIRAFLDRVDETGGSCIDDVIDGQGLTVCTLAG
ncbi:MAG: hypothetical protein ABMA25_15835 [Ilumatobacteraceae bacterium]